MKPLGRMEMQIPTREGLRGVRFDGDRAYAITYLRTDPLYTIDLSNPRAPRQRGELHIPGFIFHLEPHGDRVLGLGVDVTDPAGNLSLPLRCLEPRSPDDASPRRVRRTCASRR